MPNLEEIEHGKEMMELVHAVGQWLTLEITGEDVTAQSEGVQSKRQQLADLGWSNANILQLEKYCIERFSKSLAEAFMEVIEEGE